jgi:hypothetical protein
MANPNFQLLVDAAKLLRPILGELVFVGGCTTALLITDKAAADVRPTYDVDAIAEITSYVGYAEFSESLKALGFREDTRQGAPLCRWCQQTTTLDVMPLDGTILGSRTPGMDPPWRRRRPLAPDSARQERITTVMARLRDIASH